MTSISIEQAVSMQEEFQKLNPPRGVARAVAVITTLAAAGGKVPDDLMSYVQSWITQQQRVNRYGKAVS